MWCEELQKPWKEFVANNKAHARLDQSAGNKNSWNNASKRSFGSYSHSGILGFNSRYSAPKSRIAGIYSKNIFLFRINPKRTHP